MLNQTGKSNVSAVTAINNKRKGSKSATKKKGCGCGRKKLS